LIVSIAASLREERSNAAIADFSTMFHATTAREMHRASGAALMEE